MSYSLLHVVQEPLGGAHADPSWTSQQIKIAINENMNVRSLKAGYGSENVLTFVFFFRSLEK